jgi:hypothetical protein
MKRMLADAKARGVRLTCDSCHLDLDDFQLLEDARSKFATLLDAGK